MSPRLALARGIALALCLAFPIAGCSTEPGEKTDPEVQEIYVEGAAEQVLEEEGYRNARIGRVERRDAFNWTVTAADATGAPVCIDLRFDDLTYERFSYRLC